MRGKTVDPIKHIATDTTIIWGRPPSRSAPMPSASVYSVVQCLYVIRAKLYVGSVSNTCSKLYFRIQRQKQYDNAVAFIYVVRFMKVRITVRTSRS